METLKKLAKNTWAWVVAAFAILLGVLYFMRGSLTKALSLLRTANTQKTDAVLNERANSVEANINSSKTTEAKLDAERKEAHSDVNNSNLTDLANDFNKRLK